MRNRWLVPSVIALLLATLPACSESEPASQLKAGGHRVGEYKGYVAINQIIQTRFLEAGGAPAFAIGRYLGDYTYDSTGLSALLGGFSGEASNNEFRNGRPNSLNMLLWQIALSKLATDVAFSCGSTNDPQKLAATYPYNASFAARLKPLCAWPSSEAKQETKLLNLWQAVMGFDAPKQEYDAWRDYFLAPTSPFANASRNDSLKAMLRAMLLSPYFLLEH